MKLVLLKSRFTLDGCNYKPNRQVHHNIRSYNDRTVLSPYHADDLEELQACHQFEQHLKKPEVYWSNLGKRYVFVTFNLLGDGVGLYIDFPDVLKVLYDCFGSEASISLKVEILQLRNEQNGKEFQNAKSKKIRLIRGETDAMYMGLPYENQEFKTALQCRGILKGTMKMVLSLSNVTLKPIDKGKEKVSFIKKIWRPFGGAIQSDSKDGTDANTSYYIPEKDKETEPNPTPVQLSSSMTQQINMRILKEEIATDVLIFARDGNPVKAHKAFLSAHSDVFMTMFRTEMEEAEEHIIQLQDMSEESIRALLAFLYYGKKLEDNCNPTVAFELLCASQKYEIAVLEVAMSNFLRGKSDRWFTRKKLPVFPGRKSSKKSG